MKKKLFDLFSIFITVLMVLGVVNLPNKAVAQTPDQHLEKVENKVLDALSTEGASNYVIEMAEKADLSKAYSIMDWSERGWYVYNTLREVAARTQKPIIEILKKQGIKYQSFFAANEIAVYGSGISTLTEITSLKAVDRIRFPRTATVDPGFFSIQPSTVPQGSINALDWGITDTNADQFWSTFDMQGDGLIVANIDTGVQWDHPALDQSFKCGTNPSDPACWADPANVCGGSACDNNGHGTHTMGTMVGDDDPSLTHQVGMAPNAQWIACKGCEDKSCSDASLNACADWILAPNGNPTNRPHIVNNSWGGGGGDDWYLDKVNAWRAAGIFPAFSAGNSGPGCGTLGSPGDYQESFATASHTSSRDISSFSSRGPSAVFGDDPYTKPNISAPGSNITSSIPEDGYASSNGTSMAAPHVAGAVALLWSCNASLIGDMAATFELLQDTADPPNDAGNCGVPADGEGNFTYGYGYLNVLTAGQQVCAAGMIHGTVTDGTSPVEGATVTADNGGGLSMDTLSRANGTYTLFVPAGTYTVSATKNVYSEDIETDVVVVKGQKTTVNFVITPSNLFSGHVMGFEACDVNPDYLAGATVNFWQGTTIVATTTTNAAGYYSYALPAGTYDIEFIMDGFVTDYAEEVDLAAGETVTVDFTLRLIAPCIGVDPTSLEQTQVADTLTTQTLTIMNTGAGDGVFELFELPVSSLLLDQLILDPSFEAYTPNPYWEEFSATYGTPLCTVADCGTGTGTGSNTGDVWSWFGGSGTGDSGYVFQDVLMLPGTAEITFYAEQYVCGAAGASNYMALKIDGTDPACGVLGYRLVTVDVSDFADGDTHEIMFDSVTVDVANFFLDDVELNLEVGGDVPWLSLDPTAGVVFADSSTDVTVTYDSTGLAEGDYFAAIWVKNPPAAAINVPVTLHVTDLRMQYLPLIMR